MSQVNARAPTVIQVPASVHLLDSRLKSPRCRILWKSILPHFAISGLFMRVICALTLASIMAFPVNAEALGADHPTRFALVVGNAKYPDSDLPLKEAVNDAKDIADELKRDKFDVEI